MRLHGRQYEIMKDLHGFGLRGRLPIFISNVLKSGWDLLFF